MFCPHCEVEIENNPAASGQTLPCPACNTPFTIPHARASIFNRNRTLLTVCGMTAACIITSFVTIAATRNKTIREESALAAPAKWPSPASIFAGFQTTTEKNGDIVARGDGYSITYRDDPAQIIFTILNPGPVSDYDRWLAEMHRFYTNIIPTWQGAQPAMAHIANVQTHAVTIPYNQYDINIRKIETGGIIGVIIFTPRKN